MAILMPSTFIRSALVGTLALAMLGCGLAKPSTVAVPQASSLGAKASKAWLSFPDAPTARSRAAGAAIGHTLHLVGGEDGVRAHESFTAFDRWNQEGDAPAVAGGAMAFVPAERLLLAGGEVNGRALAAAHLWSEAKGWEALPPMPTARFDAGMAGRGVFVYVVGGTAADGRPTAAAEVFDVRDRSWKAIAPLPVATSGGVMAKTGERLTFTGGRTSSGLSQATWIYNFESNNWASGPDLPTAREGAAVATYGSVMFVVGGRTAQGLSTKVDRFQLGSGWKAESDLPFGLTGAVASKLGERLVVSGGTTADGRSSRKTIALPFSH